MNSQLVECQLCQTRKRLTFDPREMPAEPRTACERCGGLTEHIKVGCAEWALRKWHRNGRPTS